MHLALESRRPRRRWLGAVIALLLVASILPVAGGGAALAAGQMQINVQMCPDGFDGASTTLADYQQDCTIGAGVLSFDIQVDNVYWGTVDSVANGGAQIGGVPNGFVYITEQAPVGYSGVAFCEVTAVNQPPSNYTYYGDSGFAAQLGDDDYLNCNWYLVPNGSAEPTTVTVNKHWCSTGYDAYGADIYDLAASCQDDPTISIDFELTDANGMEIQSVDGQGLLDWTDVSTGDVTIDEAVPSDYGVPRVFCKQSDMLGNNNGSQEMPVQSGGSVEIAIGAGKSLYCDWFNIPAAYGEIYINKHWCPPGYAPTNDLTNLVQACQGTYDESVTFDLTGQNYGSAGGQGTGDVQMNAVIFTALPADTWTVTEQIPDGYGPPVVFCNDIELQGGNDGQYYEAPVVNGDSITVDVRPGFQVFCDWYNLADRPDTSITVRKHVCSTAGSSSWSYDDWLEACGGEPRDVRFDVSWSGGSPWTQEADSAEPLVWQGVPPGEVQIKETIPQGYGKPVVFCGASGYGGTEYEPYDASSTGTLRWELAEGEYLECDWFNVPSGTGAPLPTGPATLTIVNYRCPEGYDVLDWQAEPAVDCRDEQEGVRFTLEPEQGPSDEGVTGNNGAVTFNDVDPGDYLLAEEWPADDTAELDYAFIAACDSTNAGDNQFWPYAMIGRQPATRITLSPGEEITCAWYNVPAVEPSRGGDATITIETFDCPGSSVNPSNCDPAGAGVAFDLQPLDDGDAIELETELDGTVTAEVSAGSYELIERDTEWCFASSDAFDSDGYLTVKTGDEAVVQIYTCGG